MMDPQPTPCSFVFFSDQPSLSIAQSLGSLTRPPTGNGKECRKHLRPTLTMPLPQSPFQTTIIFFFWWTTMLILNVSTHSQLTHETPRLCGYDCILEPPQSIKMLLGTNASLFHAQLHVLNNEIVQRPQIFDVPENNSLGLAQFQTAHIEKEDPIKPERNRHIKVETGNNLNEREPISRKELTPRRELNRGSTNIIEHLISRNIHIEEELSTRRNWYRGRTTIAEELQ